MSIMPAHQNSKIPVRPHHHSKMANRHYPTNPPPPAAITNYERLIAHKTGVKILNNPYITLVTIEFVSSGSEKIVNLPVKHRNIFTALKLLDPSGTVTIGGKVITYPLEFLMETEYTETFHVITDKKTKFFRFFVHHELNSKVIVSTLKYGNHNVISTLHSLRAWMTFITFSIIA